MNIFRSFFMNIFSSFLPLFLSSSFPPPAPTHPSFLPPPLPSLLSAHLMHLFIFFPFLNISSLVLAILVFFFLLDLENHVVVFVSLCINSLIFFDWFFRNNSRSVSKSCLDNISIFCFLLMCSLLYAHPGAAYWLLGCLSRNQINTP